MKYETVIGIEIHVELKTKSKMFSSAPVSFGEKANTCVNEIDLGHPGTLPCLNKEAVRLAIKACKAFNLEIDPLLRFDRKNYYYADLPKGYQITQQFFPIGKNGIVTIMVDGKEHTVRINRLHLEEDTAKQLHSEYGTLVDYNRAGTPLIEVVSEPDMRCGLEAAAYVEKLKAIFNYLNISDVKMEEGSMRCDINISLREMGSDILGTKTEIKNLNSIANVQKAIEAEVERQSSILDNNERVIQATRRYDEALKTTVEMRKKEGDVDYKFFPEPNIPPIRLDQNWIDDVIMSMEELPDMRAKRYHTKYGLNEYDTNVLVQNRDAADFFDEVASQGGDFKKIANWIITDMSSYLNKMNLKWNEHKCQAAHFFALLDMIDKQEISGKQAKVVFEKVMEGNNPQDIVNDSGMKQVSDEGAILAIIKDVLDNNAQSIKDFKNGKDRAVGFLIGQVMKASKGQANPSLTSKLVQSELKKR